ncbi:MAG: cytochrome c [Bryobacteraceae bacterium]
MFMLFQRWAGAFVLLMWASCAALAHDIITTKLTYTRDISRIFNQRCLECHHSGTSIPLTTYEEVRPWAVSIKEQVLSRAMPPWGAVKGFGDLAPDHALSQEEMLIIAAWVIGGAPQGDPALAPRASTAAESTLTRTSLADVLSVSTRVTLAKPLLVSAITPAPMEKVNSARIVARLPDGRIQPLLWLYQYDPTWKTVFRFRTPIHLPAGTEIESNAPLKFALEASRAYAPAK